MGDNDQPPAQKLRSAWEEAEAEGMDMSLVECNLRRTVWERMLRHDKALTFALELRAAIQQRNADGPA